MSLFQNKYRIESTRLKGWDYSSNGFYFVTIVTKNREKLFGHIENKQMILNDYGKIVEQCWFDLPNHYVNCKLDAFVIMPDHVHGIIEIDNSVFDIETGQRPVSTKKRHGLSQFVGSLNSYSAKKINILRNTIGATVWQSRFYDSIIRDENSLDSIRNYITDNPKNGLDEHFG